MNTGSFSIIHVQFKRTMSNKKQTAVEWLIEKLNHLNIQKSLYKPIDFRIKKQEIIDQAKEMEKEQKVDAVTFGQINHPTFISAD